MKKPEMFHSEFLAYALRSQEIRHQMLISAQGSTRHNLSKKNFNRIRLKYPVSTTEQSKVAEVLSLVDEAIDRTRALIEKYINIKAGLMQRLLGDHACADYEKKALLGNVQIIIGGTPSTSNPDYWNGSIGWLSVDDFNNGHRFVYSAKKTITEAGLMNSSTKILKPGQIIISARGTVGVVAQMGTDLAFNQSCYGLNSSIYWTNDFLYYYLLYIADKVRSITHGNVFGTITKDTFKDILVPVLPMNDQNKAVEQLIAIDEKIETEQAYVAKLQNIKTGIM